MSLFVVAGVWREFDGGWARAAFEAYQELGDQRVRSLRALPNRGEDDTLGAELVHGSLLDPVNGFVDSATDAHMSFQQAAQPLVLYGHTHHAACWIEQPQGLPKGERIPVGYECPLPARARCMLNPGSGCDARGARWMELRFSDDDRTMIWHRTDTPGHGGVFSKILD